MASKRALLTKIDGDAVLEANVNSMRDFRNVVETNKRLLYVIGIKPSNHDSNVVRFLFRLLNVIQSIAIIFFIVPYSLDIVYNKPDFTFSQKLKQQGIVLSFFCYFVKYLAFAFQSARLRNCINQMELDWQYVFRGSREVMLKNAKFGTTVTRISIGIMLFSTITWQLFALSLGIYMVDNVTYHHLAYPAYYIIFDAYASPYYYYVFVFQIGVIVIMVGLVISTCFAVVLTTHVCCQYEILAVLIRKVDITENETLDKLDARLSRIIRKHYELLRFSSNIENAFKWICFVEWFICLSGVCLTAYLLVTEQEGMFSQAKNISILPILSYCFMIICYIGEQLMNKCESVADAAYMSYWYNLPRKQALSILMINSVFKFSKRLTGGNIIVMSVGTFSEVLKKSMAFFSILRTMI